MYFDFHNLSGTLEIFGHCYVPSIISSDAITQYAHRPSTFDEADGIRASTRVRVTHSNESIVSVCGLILGPSPVPRPTGHAMGETQSGCEVR